MLTHTRPPSDMSFSFNKLVDNALCVVFCRPLLESIPLTSTCKHFKLATAKVGTSLVSLTTFPQLLVSVATLYANGVCVNGHHILRRPSALTPVSARISIASAIFVRISALVKIYQISYTVFGCIRSLLVQQSLTKLSSPTG